MSRQKVNAKRDRKGSHAAPPPRADQPARPKRRLTSRDYCTAGELCRLMDGAYMGFHSDDYYKTVNDGERERLRVMLDDLAARVGVDAKTLRTKSVPSHRIFKASAYALDDLRAQGRPDEEAERIAESLRAEADRHAHARASLDREPARRRSRRHGPGFYETVRRLDTLKQKEGNARQPAPLCDVLALWARFMLEISPSFASTLYATLCDNWIENRDSLYDGADENDQRERTTVAFQVEALHRLSKLCGERSSWIHESDHRRRAELLIVMRRELAAMSEGIESTPAQPRAQGGAMDADTNDRIAELREKNRKLDEEDDQILRCTERMKLEKEIFDLENPIDHDDWSAWEEKEAAL